MTAVIVSAIVTACAAPVPRPPLDAEFLAGVWDVYLGEVDAAGRFRPLRERPAAVATFGRDGAYTDCTDMGPTHSSGAAGGSSTPARGG